MLAARGARAGATCRRIGVLMGACRGRSGSSGSPRGVSSGAAEIGLDRSAATCGSILAGPRPMPTDIRKHAAELVALTPDVILARGSTSRGAAVTGNPYRADCVSRMPPIRSAPALSTAWRGRVVTPPDLCIRVRHSARNGWNCLRRSRRGMTRAAVLRDPAMAAGIGQFGAIQSVAPSLGIEVSPVICATPPRSNAP